MLHQYTALNETEEAANDSARILAYAPEAGRTIVLHSPSLVDAFE